MSPSSWLALLAPIKLHGARLGRPQTRWTDARSKLPIYLHRSSGKVASIRCAGTLRGLKACLPPAIPEEESYPGHIEALSSATCLFAKVDIQWRHWHTAHQMGKSAAKKSRLAAITLWPPHHTCVGNWERYSLHRERLDQNCSTWAQAKSSFLQTGSLLRSWKLA